MTSPMAMMVSGLLRAALASCSVFGVSPEDRAIATGQYLGSGNAGERIDRSFETVVMGSVIGLPARIAMKIKRTEETSRLATEAAFDENALLW